MPKYLIRARYTTEGVRGLLKEGGSSRRQAVEKAITNLNGRMEAFYLAFGDDDAFVIADLPDNSTAAAIALAVAASGAVSTSTTVLLTPEEVDAAAQKAVDYRPPGS